MDCNINHSTKNKPVCRACGKRHYMDGIKEDHERDPEMFSKWGNPKFPKDRPKKKRSRWTWM